MPLSADAWIWASWRGASPFRDAGGAVDCCLERPLHLRQVLQGPVDFLLSLLVVLNYCHLLSLLRPLVSGRSCAVRNLCRMTVIASAPDVSILHLWVSRGWFR